MISMAMVGTSRVTDCKRNMKLISTEIYHHCEIIVQCECETSSIGEQKAKKILKDLLVLADIRIDQVSQKSNGIY